MINLDQTPGLDMSRRDHRDIVGVVSVLDTALGMAIDRARQLEFQGLADAFVVGRKFLQWVFESELRSMQP